MRRHHAIALALLLLTSLLIERGGAAALGDNTHSARGYAKGVNVSGRVSPDGKTLLTDDDNAWSVTNANALKGFEERYVTVKCRMDPAKRSIQVLSIIEDQSAMKHSANLGDSAFRR